MNRIALLITTALAAALMTACSSAQTVACHTQAGARFCLNSIHSGDYTPRVSGLKPGTEVKLQVTGKGGFPSMKVGPLVDASGRWPTGVSSALVVPENGSDVITIMATSESGEAVSVSFNR